MSRMPWHKTALIGLAVVGGVALVISAGQGFLSDVGSNLYSPVVRQPVSDAEATAFADEFAAMLGACTPADLSARLDRLAMADRILHAAHFLPGDRARITEMIAGPALASWCMALGGPGAHVLRVRPSADGPRPLIRIGGGHFDYVELTLAKSAAGVGVVDLTIFSVGTSAVESFAIGAAAYDAGKSGPALVAATEAVRRKDYAAALAQLGGLPDSVQRTTYARVMTLEATQDLDAFAAALAAFNREVPGNVAGDLRALVRYNAPGAYARLLAPIAHLNSLLGGDPELDAMAAQVQLQLGDARAALPLATAAVRAQPTSRMSWDTLLEAQLAAGDLQAIPATLTELSTRFSFAVDVGALRASEDYAFAPFLGSPVGQAWGVEHP